jgi:hypothetical protein
MPGETGLPSPEPAVNPLGDRDRPYRQGAHDDARGQETRGGEDPKLDQIHDVHPPSLSLTPQEGDRET